MENSDIVIEQTKSEVSPEGTIIEAEIAEIRQSEGTYGPQLRWQFAVVDSDRQLSGWTTTRFSERSKCYSWTKAAKGEIGPSDPFRSNELVGLRVRLLLGIKAGTDGSEFNVIKDVLPPETQQSRFGGIFS